MRQDAVQQEEDGRAGLGRLLMNGAMRLGRQVRLSKGQSAALMLFLFGAVGLGFAIEPGPRDAARPEPSAPVAPPEPVGAAAGKGGIERIDAAGGAADRPDAGSTDVADGGSTAGARMAAQSGAAPSGTAASTSVALDRLAAEIAKINKRLDDVVSDEKLTQERVAALGSVATAPARAPSFPTARKVLSDRVAGSSQPAPPRGVFNGRRDVLIVHRAPSPAARPIASPYRRAAKPLRVTERVVPETRPARRRRLAGPRTFSDLPLHF